MKIGSLDTADQVLVIAEIGNNHEGDVKVAAEMVAAAANAGVDAVKFQTFRTELFANPKDAARYERLRQFELTPAEFSSLRDLAHSLGLLFLSTPLDLESAKFLNNIVDAFKIASGDNNFFPLLGEVASTGKPVIISTGASDIEQVCKSKDYVKGIWNQLGINGQLAVLHCVSNYPTTNENANLSVIPTLFDSLQCEIGYSDHTLGIDACVLSIALGSRIIEKHFTLDHHFSDFRDHQISADPEEMDRLVSRVRLATQLLGGTQKKILASEAEIAPLIRRSIVAAIELPVGHCIAREDLLWIRPGDGLPPGDEEKLIGKFVLEDIGRAEPILLEKVA